MIPIASHENGGFVRLGRAMVFIPNQEAQRVRGLQQAFIWTVVSSASYSQSEAMYTAIADLDSYKAHFLS